MIFLSESGTKYVGVEITSYSIVIGFCHFFKAKIFVHFTKFKVWWPNSRSSTSKAMATTWIDELFLVSSYNLGISFKQDRQVLLQKSKI